MLRREECDDGMGEDDDDVGRGSGMKKMKLRSLDAARECLRPLKGCKHEDVDVEDVEDVGRGRGMRRQRSCALCGCWLLT